MGSKDDDKLKGKDFYAILGVEKTATESQIKNSYRKLAMKYHPDKNPGDHESAEKFKEISIAYAVLSDPNKRRQYDVSGPSGAVVDFEGIDPSELGSVGRAFGALFSKLGVPIPTQISPKVLATARELTEGRSGAAHARVLRPGEVVTELVGKQEPVFYKFSVDPKQAATGLILLCRSPAMSKFKLILFDKEGGVRQIEESNRKKLFTSAELYFVPFDRAVLSELFPLKFFQEDKEVPLQFHLLDGLEPSSNVRLEPREHLVCVYGDNWIKDVKFNLQLLPAAVGHPSIPEIEMTEKELLAKKSAMSLFQPEFIEAKKRYEAALTRLEAESKEIVDLLKKREASYDQFIEASAAPYSGALDSLNQQQVNKGLFSFFGGK